eukprot:COSAG02_NODE_24047_length_699_cov_1.211667_1_plen_38_part_10
MNAGAAISWAEVPYAHIAPLAANSLLATECRLRALFLR